ncbi:MAG: hypothetical protein KGJ86_00515 [Chloroflexota bacterium]|nr:hypothetical protein [Chloroflexota bacterium]
MGYARQATQRIDLPAEVGDGLWISIRNPKMLALTDLLAITDLTATGGDNRQAAGQVASLLIVDWNLTDMYHPDDPTVLPVPAADAGSLGKVPWEAVLAVAQAFAASQAPDPNSTAPLTESASS